MKEWRWTRWFTSSCDTAIGRRQVGDMGFSAYVFDSENNLIGLWQST